MTAPSLTRRGWLTASGFTMAAWLNPVAHLLARESEDRGQPAQSVILLWLAGGPSQLETFDPHPGTEIGGETTAIDTRAKDIRIADTLPAVAEQMDRIALVRNIVSREGDHQRGTYLVKTGYTPLPTLVHPTLGAIVADQLPTSVPGLPKTNIPRHVAILPGPWPAWGGYLGAQHDAFKTYDPVQQVPNVTSRVSAERTSERYDDLAVVEQSFARGRAARVARTRHVAMVDEARAMMTSDQLRAFDVSSEPQQLRQRYGDTPFGRSCLAARRLIEVGVRCVEVTLDGWDSHINNHEVHQRLCGTLDPAFAALLADLRDRGLLERTLVVCGGEFGRTPKINGADGRDHWASGFSMALAGGRIRGGTVVGETDPAGSRLKPEGNTNIADVHATILSALGIDPAIEKIAPGSRPIKLSEGKPIPQLLASR